MASLGMCCRPRGQAGFSLVELMVAMVLGLVVVAGGLQVVSSIQQTFRATERLAERQNRLIMVSELLARDVRTAEALALEDDGTTLALRLPGSRRADYCGAGSGAFTLRYALDSDAPRLLLDLTDCGGSIEPLADGIAAVDFTLRGADPDAPHTVEVTLHPADGNAATPIAFRTTSRALALAIKENNA